MSIFVIGMLNSDEPIPTIDILAATTVKQDARKIEYVKKEEPRTEVTSLSQPSSDPSDS